MSDVTRHPNWGQAADVHYPAWVLDEPELARNARLDPVVALASARLTGDKEGVRRGLMFVGEVREGNDIVRQYRWPTRWRRLRFALLKPRLVKPLRRSQNNPETAAE
jgi:hypothetical protein